VYYNTRDEERQGYWNAICTDHGGIPVPETHHDRDNTHRDNYDGSHFSAMPGLCRLSWYRLMLTRQARINRPCFDLSHRSDNDSALRSRSACSVSKRVDRALRCCYQRWYGERLVSAILLYSCKALTCVACAHKRSRWTASHAYTVSWANTVWSLHDQRSHWAM